MGVPGETLDLGLPDRTMMTHAVSFSLLGASFWSNRWLEGTRGQAVLHLPHGRRRISVAWRRGVSATSTCGWIREGWWRCVAPWWRRRQPGNGDALVLALERDWWKTAAVIFESASDRCVTQSRCVAGLGHPTLDVRHWCDVYLVFRSDIRHTFIKGIGVATSVA